MSKRKPNGYWTEERVREEAKKYGSKSEFALLSKGAYKAAKGFDILDRLGFSSSKRPDGFWGDVENVLLEIAKYKTRDEFRLRCNRAYVVAARMGILDDHLPLSLVYWGDVEVRAEAKKHTSRAEFQRSSPSGYRAARRLGIIDDLGFSDRSPTDNDAIYIWRAVGCTFNGNPVFKIGVTSQRLGTRRIEQVARAAGLEYELICCEPVLGKATDLEAKLHLLGEDPEMRGFDGATEFRALSDSALEAALALIGLNKQCGV